MPRAPRGALPPHVPGEHRHPELHGPPRPRRLPRDHRGDQARQPAAADLRPGLPGAVRVRLRPRRQRRRRLHPADEGQGGRAVPRRGRLPEARDRARRRASASASSAPGRPASPRPTTCARSATRSRSSRRRSRPAGCCATASRPTACRPTCSSRSSTRSGRSASGSTPAPRSTASRPSARSYDAVFLGLGTQRSRLIPVEGVHQPFVLGGIDFLRAVRSGEPVRVGPRVVVIGGGNVSIDVALTALRQGARHVDLTSLEKRRDMPASPARSSWRWPRACSCTRAGGRCASRRRARPSSSSASGRRTRPAASTRSSTPSRLLRLEADQVILATGQGTDLAILEGSGVENTRGFIVADPKTKMTREPGVFAGGDGAARPADGRGGDPLREDRGGLHRRLAARGAARTPRPASRCAAPSVTPAGRRRVRPQPPPPRR